MAVRSVLHWGPLVATYVILHVSITTVMALPHHVRLDVLSVWLVLVALWCLNVVGIVFCFLNAIYTGAGVVPPRWAPEDAAAESQLQFCQICLAFKAPRSHHCHQCGQCMKKMDHHCPWINGCVGNDNHLYFLGFVSLVPIGCSYSAVVLLLEAMRLLRLRRFHQDEALRLLQVFFGFGLALGTTFAVSFLAFIQARIFVRNRTGIEDWILAKAEMRRPEDQPYQYPYDLGWRRNIQENVVRCLHGDGLTWSVREGCDQYSLTREQLEQKAEKRKFVQTVVATQTGGKCCGVGFGLRTFLEGVWMFDGTKIRVQEGDIINVWNSREHWVYGQIMVQAQDGSLVMRKPRVRGWLPKATVKAIHKAD